MRSLLSEVSGNAGAGSVMHCVTSQAFRRVVRAAGRQTTLRVSAEAAKRRWRNAVGETPWMPLRAEPGSTSAGALVSPSRRATVCVTQDAYAIWLVTSRQGRAHGVGIVPEAGSHCQQGRRCSNVGRTLLRVVVIVPGSPTGATMGSPGTVVSRAAFPVSGRACRAGAAVGGHRKISFVHGLPYAGRVRNRNACI